MKEALQAFTILAIGLIAAALISYGLASLGEPQSVWLWSFFR